MALAPCRECGKEISTEATVCPNCGKKNPTTRGIAFTRPAGCFLIFIVLALIGALMSSTDKPRSPAAPADSARLRVAAAAQKARDSVNTQLAAAKQLCHDAAVKSLKAPATADFVDDETYFKDLGKGRSHIQLQVDAENSFGAKIRTTVDCKTRQSATSVRLTSFDSWSR